jgi:hypothetical protein
LRADNAALFRRRLGVGALDAKQLANEAERRPRTFSVRFECVVKVAPQTRITSDLDDLAGAIKVVVDAVRVGDQIAWWRNRPSS